MKIAFFASHGGSNMQAVIDAIRSGILQMQPAIVISNNRKSKAVERAEAESIPSAVLNSTTHPDPDALDTAILTTLTEYGADLILLAGYMKMLGPAFCIISVAAL